MKNASKKKEKRKKKILPPDWALRIYEKTSPVLIPLFRPFQNPNANKKIHVSLKKKRRSVLKILEGKLGKEKKKKNGPPLPFFFVYIWWGCKHEGTTLFFRNPNFWGGAAGLPGFYLQNNFLKAMNKITSVLVLKRSGIFFCASQKKIKNRPLKMLKNKIPSNVLENILKKKGKKNNRTFFLKSNKKN